MRFVKANIRDYALLISLLAIMVFFQFTTGGTLFTPLNMTNIILQNSYIVIMALGMLLIIVAGHIDLSVGFRDRLRRRGCRRDDGDLEVRPLHLDRVCLALRRAHRHAAGLFRGLLTRSRPSS